MKKFMTGVLVLVLTLGMGVTVFAAPSVTPTKTEVRCTNAVLADGTVVTGQVSVTENVSKDIVAEAGSEAVKARSDAQVLAVREVSLADGIPAGSSVTIEFYVTGIMKGHNIQVLHKGADGWESLKYEIVENEKVKVEFTSLSPVVFVNLPIYSPEYYAQAQAATAPAPAAGTPATPAATAAVSPKTAEDNGIAGFAAVAVLCTAAVVFTGKKKNA